MSTIRRATAADRERLLEVWLRAVRATHAFLDEQDVQDPQGLAFYLQSGFVQAGRSERDSAGRPFPILHLREAA